ncbi:hypothetical protein GCM10017764_29440 [Sphingobacterium griseoflavum]|uniref:Uncharacterized protein n=2 Tax=Sphingobacterium griseoflavum TaxID=1474952 RepID=A0ABQ3HXE8_9SPHI|nr:hypothetical protein GCM10017764_29440 [Sphingobacterium griseoflavum]
MHCEPDSVPLYPIIELENVKAYVKITPEKDVYKVGDTIMCTLRIDRKDWNNWTNFEKATFNSFALYSYDGASSKFLEPIAGKGAVPNGATVLPNGHSYIEQITYYELTVPKIYVFGPLNWLSDLKVYQNFQYLNVTYEDVSNNKWYMAEVPIYFKNNNKQYIEIKVEN